MAFTAKYPEKRASAQEHALRSPEKCLEIMYFIGFLVKSEKPACKLLSRVCILHISAGRRSITKCYKRK